MLKRLVPSAIAVLTAVFVSITLVDDVVVILACMTVALVGLGVAGVRSIQTGGSRWRAFGSAMTPVVLFVAIAWSHVPLHIAFRLHRSQFDEVAAQIEAGDPPVTPFWIGPFKIERAGRRGASGTPYLAVNAEPSEVDGFVRHPDGHGFNLWSCITLDDSWSVIAED